jgi:riboflavin transporter FmnP
MIVMAIITTLSVMTASYIFFFKEPKTFEDKVVGTILATGAIMLFFWPQIKDKLVWG